MPEPVSPAIVNVLAQTRPWVRLAAVVALLIAVLTEVRLLFQAITDTDPDRAKDRVILGLMMLPPLLYVPAWLFLKRYAASIRGLQNGGGPASLEEALAHQKSFWKYVGVLLLVTGIAIAALVLGGIVLGLASRR